MVYQSKAFRVITKPLTKPTTINNKIRPQSKQTTNKQKLQNMLFA